MVRLKTKIFKKSSNKYRFQLILQINYMQTSSEHNSVEVNI